MQSVSTPTLLRQHRRRTYRKKYTLSRRDETIFFHFIHHAHLRVTELIKYLAFENKPFTITFTAKEDHRIYHTRQFYPNTQPNEIPKGALSLYSPITKAYLTHVWWCFVLPDIKKSIYYQDLIEQLYAPNVKIIYDYMNNTSDPPSQHLGDECFVLFIKDALEVPVKNFFWNINPIRLT